MYYAGDRKLALYLVVFPRAYPCYTLFSTVLSLPGLLNFLFAWCPPLAFNLRMLKPANRPADHLMSKRHTRRRRESEDDEFDKAIHVFVLANVISFKQEQKGSH